MRLFSTLVVIKAKFYPGILGVYRPLDVSLYSHIVVSWLALSPMGSFPHSLFSL